MTVFGPLAGGAAGGSGVLPVEADAAASNVALTPSGGPSYLPLAFVGPPNGWTLSPDNQMLPPVAGVYALTATVQLAAAATSTSQWRLFTTFGSAAFLLSNASSPPSRTYSWSWTGPLDPANGVGLLMETLNGVANINASWAIHAIRVN